MADEELAPPDDKLGWIDDALHDRAVALVRAAGVPAALDADSPLDRDAFERIMAVDKKVADGQLRLILLRGALGNCVVTADYDKAALRATIDHFCARENRAA